MPSRSKVWAKSSIKSRGGIPTSEKFLGSVTRDTRTYTCARGDDANHYRTYKQAGPPSRSCASIFFDTWPKANTPSRFPRTECLMLNACVLCTWRVKVFLHWNGINKYRQATSPTVNNRAFVPLESTLGRRTTATLLARPWHADSLVLRRDP